MPSQQTVRVWPNAAEDARAIIPPFKLMSLSATGRTRSDRTFTLTEKDFDHRIVRQRLDAKKRLILKPLKTEADLTPTQLDSLLAESLADEAWQIAARDEGSPRHCLQQQAESRRGGEESPRRNGERS